MADQCEPLFDIRKGIVEKITKAHEAISSAGDGLATSFIALGAAQASAGICPFLGAPPAILACAATAAIAIAAASAAVLYYKTKLQEAQEALQNAQEALDRVDDLISHCSDLQAWQEQALRDLLAQAPDPDSLPDVEEVDMDLAEEAEEAVAALMGELADYDSAYA